MRILNRYVLREHIGPFFFALTALTSLMLLQYIAKNFGNLVGKGIRWQVILEFFLLALPFTIAVTVPISVLVAVLYSFSRLASENEITALKAGGYSTRSLVNTVLLAAAAFALGMVAFNDQVMPWANHRLATLQYNIAITKPTFALREQVINEIQPERLFLRAGHIDEATSKLKDVTIYDVSDPARRRTIIADSGRIALAPNMRDIALTLEHGYILAVPTKQQSELDRLYFKVDHIRVRDVANQFQQTSADSTLKGDREMTVCEMQREYERASREYQRTKADVADAIWIAKGSVGPRPPGLKKLMTPVGIGGAYCRIISWVTGRLAWIAPKPAHAAELSRPSPPAVTPDVQAQAQQSVDVTIQETQLDGARLRMDRYGIEIQKKFSLAAACLVLAFVGAPIALRFPRGGMGFVIAVSFGIYSLYYVGLTVGESLANKGYITPFWAMWLANIVFTVVGMILYTRIGSESGSARGGDLAELWYLIRRRFERRPGDETPAQVT